jgi:alpha-L-fucosidase
MRIRASPPGWLIFRSELLKDSKTVVMKRYLIAAMLIVLVFSCTPSKEKETESTLSEQDARMEWWKEARFGLFIHWGLYAQPAGEWKGEEIPGISEWIMARAEIPVSGLNGCSIPLNPEPIR